MADTLGLSLVHATSHTQVKVLSVSNLGVVVRLAEHTQGFIPSIFWADVQLRNPAKRFKEDETLTAMVRPRITTHGSPPTARNNFL